MSSIQVKEITVSFPGWRIPDGSGRLDPARFNYPDVTLQIFGTPLDLRYVLGLRDFEELARAMPYRERLFDVPVDSPICPGYNGETVLDRLCALGCLTVEQRGEIEKYLTGCGEDSFTP